MDDNEFWINFVRCVIAFFCVLIITAGGCSSYQSALIADAIKNGADPIAARCGVVGPKDPDALCALYVSKPK
jgi:hypothetical protein